MKPLLITLIFSPLLIFGQYDYKNECSKLIELAYYQELKIDKIENQFTILGETIDKNNIQTCNCADSIWIELRRDKRNFPRWTHSIKLDTSSYLHHLVIRVDSLILNREFKDLSFTSNVDSFNYVINRVLTKRLRSRKSKPEIEKFFHCIDPESIYLKKNRLDLLSNYLVVFDDKKQDLYIRDLILNSLFYSNNCVEDEILKRIDKVEEWRFFYRMVGILRTSGGMESINYFNSIIPKIKEEDKVKAIVTAVYTILKNILEITKKIKTNVNNPPQSPLSVGRQKAQTLTTDRR